MKYVSFLMLIIGLTACTVGPDYHAPDMDAPDAWHAGAGRTGVAARSARWWENFHDATLDDLIEQALSNNQQIKLAEARLTEERANRLAVASALYPQISLGGNTTRGNQTTAQSAAFIPSSLAGAGGGDDPKPVTVAQATFDASWEPDLFGGTRRQVEAEQAQIEGAQADVRAVQLALIGDVAQNYIGLRQLQAQAAIIRKTAKAQQNLAGIANRSYKVGTGSRFEAAEAEALAQSTDARLPELKRQEQALSNQLSVLLGETAGPLGDRLHNSAPLPKPIMIPALQAPAETLRQRPDVRAVERALAAATALQGAAIAEAYPKVTLSALFGVLDTSLSDPVRIWSYTGGVAAPLFTFGRIEGQINAANARERQAFYRYRQTVLQAVADVETQLQNVAWSNVRAVKLKRAARSASEAVGIARKRYTNGVAPFTEVLNAEQQFYQVENDHVIAQGQHLNYLVALHKALGLLPPTPSKESSHVTNVR